MYVVVNVFIVYLCSANLVPRAFSLEVSIIKSAKITIAGKLSPLFDLDLFLIVVPFDNSSFCLKPLQVKCFEYLLKGKYVVAVLPTGFGKSMLFQLLPDFLPVKADNDIV